jgi:hypothetical protein
LSAPLLNIFPVPADALCTMRTSDGSKVLAVSVLGADGRVIDSPVLMGDALVTSSLSAGSYLLSVRTTTGVSKARLVVGR